MKQEERGTSQDLNADEEDHPPMALRPPWEMKTGSTGCGRILKLERADLSA
jgi:hypothetical protein